MIISASRVIEISLENAAAKAIAESLEDDLMLAAIRAAESGHYEVDAPIMTDVEQRHLEAIMRRQCIRWLKDAEGKKTRISWDFDAASELLRNKTDQYHTRRKAYDYVNESITRAATDGLRTVKDGHARHVLTELEMAGYTVADDLSTITW